MWVIVVFSCWDAFSIFNEKIICQIPTMIPEGLIFVGACCAISNWSVFFHWLRVALCQVTTRFLMFCINTEVVS